MKYPNMNERVKTEAGVIKEYCKNHKFCGSECVFYRGSEIVDDGKMQYEKYNCAFGEKPKFWGV